MILLYVLTRVMHMCVKRQKSITFVKSNIKNSVVRKMIKSVIIVGLGSFAGGALRYVLSHVIKTHCCAGCFPWPTLVVNLSGCLLLGAIYGMFCRLGAPANNWSLLLATGLCGGFTTFSTFSHECLQMLQNGNIWLLIAYISMSLILGLSLMAFGIWIVK